MCYLYGMQFIEFKKQKMVEKNSHSFRIEEDYCDGELAIDGIQSVTAERKKMREIPMSLDGFVAEIEAAAQKYALNMDNVAKTKNAIKIRFNISEYTGRSLPCSRLQ
jgi:hypothetical protein